MGRKTRRLKAGKKVREGVRRGVSVWRDLASGKAGVAEAWYSSASNQYCCLFKYHRKGWRGDSIGDMTGRKIVKGKPMKERKKT